jgi:hypothetical protein
MSTDDAGVRRGWRSSRITVDRPGAVIVYDFIACGFDAGCATFSAVLLPPLVNVLVARKGGQPPGFHQGFSGGLVRSDGHDRLID